MRPAVTSGISPNFLELSQSRGQVAHVLLTRSPLNFPPKRKAPFDLHVLSTPPAFVLSQDQTLRRCLNQAENRELTLAMSLNPKKPTKRGCYLALTFGTLLSSQGADAQRLDPLGLRLWRLVPLYAVSGVLHPGVLLRGPPGPVRRMENHTRLSRTVRKSVGGVPRHTLPAA